MKGLRELHAQGGVEKVKALTACTACLQGLSRYRDEVPVEPAYIVTELAEQILGEGWQRGFVDRAKQGGIERVLL